MAIGFQDLNGTFRLFDKGVSVENSPNVRVSQFGDGYQQRLSYGLNSNRQTLSASFTDRSKEEIDAIVTFFESLQGVRSFEVTLPYGGDGVPATIDPTEKTLRVICSQWNQIYTYDNFYSLTAQFKRVYETNAQ